MTSPEREAAIHIIEFDCHWHERIWALDRFRRKHNLPLHDPTWALICDAADELISVPALGSSVDMTDDLAALRSAQVKEIYGYFLPRLEVAKAGLLEAIDRMESGTGPTAR